MLGQTNVVIFLINTKINILIFTQFYELFFGLKAELFEELRDFFFDKKKS